jgi:hypothetical protein
MAGKSLHPNEKEGKMLTKMRVWTGTTLLVCLATLCISSDDAELTSSTTQPALFPGPVLPESPHQHDEWPHPDTRLPASLVNATDSLFSQGMADPRGCEYRAVQVAVGNVWSGGGEPVATHGWVFPDPQRSPRQFVVCWNGLVYPAVKVGPPADVKADIDGTISRDQDTRKPKGEQGRDVPDFRSMGQEEAAVSFETMATIKVCLLLRAGETDLARQYWEELFRNPAGHESNTAGCYMQIATEWALDAFDRAVCAHMRGDDAVSAAMARLLTAASPQIEGADPGRQAPGTPRKPSQNAAGASRRTEHLSFLEPLAALLADEERRVNAQSKPMPLEQATKIPDQSRRIAALIEDFEEIKERQWGQPGGVGVDSSPIVIAIEKEGQSAVEPLIACLENDKRLTRSVSFWRDFSPQRNLIPVTRAAYLAICHILQTHEFGPASNGFNRGGGPDRKAIIAEVRAYWAKAKGKSPADMWYATLKDDGAGSSRWLEAALKIVQPVDVEARGGWVNDPVRKPGEIPATRGEPLRGKQNPSVSELLAKRIPQVADDYPNGNSDSIFRSHDGARMALAFHKWDPKAGFSTLQSQLARSKEVFARDRGNQATMLADDVAELTIASVAKGDQGALKDYAAWIRAQWPSRDNSAIPKMFRPMAQHPDQLEIATAAEALFNDPSSPWFCLPKGNPYQTFGPDGDMVASPLLCVPAFQKNVLVNLDDKTHVGAVSVVNGSLQVEMRSGLGFSAGITYPTDPLLPAAGEKREIRVCDWYASHLANLDGAPEFEFFWPEKRREEAIKAASEFVRRWAARFAPNDLQDALDQKTFYRVHMTFPKLDHPATAADEKEGRAVFSIAELGKAKVVHLKPFPISAKWKTFKQVVVHYQTNDRNTGAVKNVTIFDQDGVVWQAEEVMEGKKLERYYGFVGNHVIAKVPAEDIQLFPDVPAWDLLPQ